MNTTKYFVFPAGKPEEKFEVLPHTFGENGGVSSVSFAKAELAKTGNLNDWYKATELFTFSNPENDGAFVNNDTEQLDVTGVYDIMKEEVAA